MVGALHLTHVEMTYSLLEAKEEAEMKASNYIHSILQLRGWSTDCSILVDTACRSAFEPVSAIAMAI